MFVCVMFASHPTIVVHILLILKADKGLFTVHHRRRTSCSGAIEITLTLPISGLSTSARNARRANAVFFSLYVEIYPDNLSPNPSAPPSPAPTKKSCAYPLWYLVMIEQRDYVTVKYSVTSKLRVK